MHGQTLRLSKVVSTSGLSRQAARQAIERGRVSLNGKICRAPGQRVEPHDAVLLSGKPVAYPADEDELLAAARVWCYNKPAGLITTHKDPDRRPTVFEALRGQLDTQHLISVGRLDLDSEGLLLLTDTGALARRLELPQSGFVREYAVELACSPHHVTSAMFAELREGLVLGDDGTRLRPIRADLTSPFDGDGAPQRRMHAQQTWVRMALTEGKRREIRRAWETLGFLVTRLVRTAYGPFRLLRGQRQGDVRESMPTSTERHALMAALAALPRTPARPRGAESRQPSASS